MKRTEPTIAHVTGSKYEAVKDLDITQIAKRIRADLKAVGTKASVRVSRYAGGQSVNVTIPRVLPALEALDRGHPEWVPMSWLSREDFARHETATAILESYRDTRSEWASDYVSANFYGSVSVR